MFKTSVELIEYLALKHYGKLYRWGANGPQNFDCSGFICSLFKEIGWLNKSIDLTAQDLYRFCSDKNFKEEKKRGSILFFGKSRERITHIELMITKFHSIGASGGDHLTISDPIAIGQNARIKISPIRNDLVAYLFHEEVLQ